MHKKERQKRTKKRKEKKTFSNLLKKSISLINSNSTIALYIG